MATRAQKTKVGVFLLASAVVIAIGLYMISYYGTRGEQAYFVQFQESVLGLNVGGQVVFMGIPIGTVDELTVRTVRDPKTGVETYRPQAKILIKEGFVLRESVRARLTIYSLATGTLAIILEGGSPEERPLPEWSVIPAQQSAFQAVSSRAEEVMNSLQDTLKDIDVLIGRFNTAFEGLGEGEFTRIVRDAAETIRETRDLAASANDTFSELQDDATEGVKDLRNLVADVKKLTQETTTLVSDINAKIEPLDLGSTQVKINEVLDRTDSLMAEVETLAQNLNKATETVSQKTGSVEYSIREGLRSLTETLQSLKEMIEYLRENPSALIRGRGAREGE